MPVAQHSTRKDTAVGAAATRSCRSNFCGRRSQRRYADRQQQRGAPRSLASPGHAVDGRVGRQSVPPDLARFVVPADMQHDKYDKGWTDEMPTGNYIMEDDGVVIKARQRQQFNAASMRGDGHWRAGQPLPCSPS